MSHAPNNCNAPSVEPSPEQQGQPRALARASGSVFVRLAVAEAATHGMSDIEAAREMMRAISSEQRRLGQLVPTTPDGFELAARWWEWSAKDSNTPDEHRAYAANLRTRALSPNNKLTDAPTKGPSPER